MMGFKDGWKLGTVTTLQSAVSVAGTEIFTTVLELISRWQNVSFDVNFDGDNATDDLIIKIYKRITDDTFTGNETARRTITVTSDGSADDFSFEILKEDMGPGYYRLGMVRSGSATTFTITTKYQYGRNTRGIG